MHAKCDEYKNTTKLKASVVHGKLAGAVVLPAAPVLKELVSLGLVRVLSSLVVGARGL
jgi:hypothetical protein